VIAQGQREGDFAATLEPQAAARALFAAVQGCLAASRLFGDSERMDGILEALTASARTQAPTAEAPHASNKQHATV